MSTTVMASPASCRTRYSCSADPIQPCPLVFLPAGEMRCRRLRDGAARLEGVAAWPLTGFASPSLEAPWPWSGGSPEWCARATDGRHQPIEGHRLLQPGCRADPFGLVGDEVVGRDHHDRQALPTHGV